MPHRKTAPIRLSSARPTLTGWASFPALPTSVIPVAVGLLLAVFLAPAHAATVYISNSGGSVSCGTDGTQSTTAYISVSWTAGNTYKICGTITGPVTVNASGTSGSPILIAFETGGGIVNAICPSSGCLNISGRSWITVDGGTTCGWISGAEVTCNGQIGSSASGTAYGNETSTFAIEATNCANCEIRNLQIGPVYVKAQNDGGTPSGDVRGIDQLGITTTAVSFLVHNNIIHDASSAVAYVPGSTNDNGLQYYDNYVYNNNSGLDISNNDNGDLTAALVHNNHFASPYNWDDPGCPNHHNSMHAFAYTTTNSGVQFYNNLVDGNWGGCPTSELFYEGSSSVNNNCTVFNNLFLGTYTQENNGVVSITCGGTVQIYNNTVIGALQSGDICLSLEGLTGATVKVENNIISGCNTLLATGNPANFWATWNNTTWGGDPSGTPWAVACGDSGCSYYSFTGWQAACGCDGAGSFGSSASHVGTNPSGTLLSTSPAIASGANLTSIGIIALDADIAGSARPATGAWAGGAYNYSSASGIPVSPTGLSATVR